MASRIHREVYVRFWREYGTVEVDDRLCLPHEKAEEKFLAMKKIYTTLLGMFADEMRQEELEKDECYGCAYGKCGPCIGICYKSMKA